MPQKLSGKVWMAQDFPLSLRELLPLLDVAGAANKCASYATYTTRIFCSAVSYLACVSDMV